MEQVFFRLHVRFVSTMTRVLSPKVRGAAERLCLCVAVALLLLLASLHLRFVNPAPQNNCLTQMLGDEGGGGEGGGGLPPEVWRQYDLMQVHITTEGGRERKEALQAQAQSLLQSQSQSQSQSHSHSHAHSLKTAAETANPDGTDRGDSRLQELERKGTLFDSFIEFVGLHYEESAAAAAVAAANETIKFWQAHEAYLFDMFLSEKVYLFSTEKGFLMMRPHLRERHNVTVYNVTVSLDNGCFGPAWSQSVLQNFIGYDTIVMNWFIQLYGGRGYLYNVFSKELFNLNYAAEFVDSTFTWDRFFVFKLGVLFTTLFLFFTTTTLVSFTLRETQERMLKFTFLLQHHVRHRIPYASLVFTHVVESLVFVPIMVGILFFLFEFFSDQLLAFMVLSLVWLSEVYSVISVRTVLSLRFFPRIFFLFFSLFHIYFFSFPFGYSYLALWTTVAFLGHSMLYFWSRHEIPAIEQGRITAAHPRFGAIAASAQQQQQQHAMAAATTVAGAGAGAGAGGIGGAGAGPAEPGPDASAPRARAASPAVVLPSGSGAERSSARSPALVAATRSPVHRGAAPDTATASLSVGRGVSATGMTPPPRLPPPPSPPTYAVAAGAGTATATGAGTPDQSGHTQRTADGRHHSNETFDSEEADIGAAAAFGLEHASSIGSTDFPEPPVRHRLTAAALREQERQRNAARMSMQPMAGWRASRIPSAGSNNSEISEGAAESAPLVRRAAETRWRRNTDEDDSGVVVTGPNVSGAARASGRTVADQLQADCHSNSDDSNANAGRIAAAIRAGGGDAAVGGGGGLDNLGGDGRADASGARSPDDNASTTASSDDMSASQEGRPSRKGWNFFSRWRGGSDGSTRRPGISEVADQQVAESRRIQQQQMQRIMETQAYIVGEPSVTEGTPDAGDTPPLSAGLAAEAAAEAAADEVEESKREPLDEVNGAEEPGGGSSLFSWFTGMRQDDEEREREREQKRERERGLILRRLQRRQQAQLEAWQQLEEQRLQLEQEQRRRRESSVANGEELGPAELDEAAEMERSARHDQATLAALTAAAETVAAETAAEAEEEKARHGAQLKQQSQPAAAAPGGGSRSRTSSKSSTGSSPKQQAMNHKHAPHTPPQTHLLGGGGGSGVDALQQTVHIGVLPSVAESTIAPIPAPPGDSTGRSHATTKHIPDALALQSSTSDSSSASGATALSGVVLSTHPSQQEQAQRDLQRQEPGAPTEGGPAVDAGLAPGHASSSLKGGNSNSDNTSSNTNSNNAGGAASRSGSLHLVDVDVSDMDMGPLSTRDTASALPESRTSSMGGLVGALRNRTTSESVSASTTLSEDPPGKADRSSSVPLGYSLFSRSSAGSNSSDAVVTVDPADPVARSVTDASDGTITSVDGSAAHAAGLSPSRPRIEPSPAAAAGSAGRLEDATAASSPTLLRVTVSAGPTASTAPVSTDGGAPTSAVAPAAPAMEAEADAVRGAAGGTDGQAAAAGIAVTEAAASGSARGGTSASSPSSFSPLRLFQKLRPSSSRHAQPSIHLMAAPTGGMIRSTSHSSVASAASNSSETAGGTTTPGSLSRVPSVNDFGYRRNEFIVFGHDLDDGMSPSLAGSNSIDESQGESSPRTAGIRTETMSVTSSRQLSVGSIEDDESDIGARFIMGHSERGDSPEPRMSEDGVTETMAREQAVEASR